MINLLDWLIFQLFSSFINEYQSHIYEKRPIRQVFCSICLWLLVFALRVYLWKTAKKKLKIEINIKHKITATNKEFQFQFLFTIILYLSKLFTYMNKPVIKSQIQLVPRIHTFSHPQPTLWQEFLQQPASSIL